MRSWCRQWPGQALSLLVAACSTAAVGSDPVSVVQGYYDAISDQRVDHAMEFIAEGAVVVSPDGRFEGREAIRAFLEEITTGGTLRVELSNLLDEGGKVSYSYQFSQGGSVSISGDDGFTVVADGQMVFDGTRGGWTLKCTRDASQVFCAGY